MPYEPNGSIRGKVEAIREYHISGINKDGENIGHGLVAVAWGLVSIAEALRSSR